MRKNKASAASTKSKAFIASLIAGLIAPGSLLHQTQYNRITGSDLGRLRGDTIRVGMDFQRVIMREKINPSGKKNRA